MRVRPLTGKVMVRVLGPIEASSIIETPDRHVPPEEQQVLNHKPTPPLPLVGIVESIGPWPTLKNGLRLLPPFVEGAKVLLRAGSGQQLARGVGEKLRMVDTNDVLAVLT